MMNGEWMAMNYHAAILPHLRVLPMCRVAKKLKAIAEPYSDCRLADNFGNRYANARFQKPPQKSSELGIIETSRVQPNPKPNNKIL